MKSNVPYDIYLDLKNKEPSIWTSLPDRMISCRNRKNWLKPINKPFISTGWAVQIGTIKTWLTPGHLVLLIICHLPLRRVNNAKKETNNLQLKTNLRKLNWNSWHWKCKRWKKKRSFLKINYMNLYISLKNSKNS